MLFEVKIFPNTLGMKFEGVTLTDCVARVKFSQPKNETNYGSLGSMIFCGSNRKDDASVSDGEESRNLRRGRNADRFGVGKAFPEMFEIGIDAIESAP